MSLIVLYLLTAAIFLGLDVLGLKFLVGPVFEARVGSILLDQPRIGAAALFYLFYIAALLWLVTLPGLGGSIWLLALNAAIFGAAAYGTYEFTNLATLRGWTWTQVAVDVAWGTALTAFSAVMGLKLARAFGLPLTGV